MEIDWQQLGAAGVLGLFALQVIREILNFKGRTNDGNGNYAAVKRAISDGLQPIAQDMREVRGDTEKLRASQHRANDIQTTVAGKLDLAHHKLDTVLRHVEHRT